MKKNRKFYIRNLKNSLKNTPDDCKVLIKALEEICGVQKEDLKD